MKIAVLVAAAAFLSASIDLGELAARIGSVSPLVLVAVLLLVAANFLTTTWRLIRIVRLSGHTLRVRTGLLANASGLVASLFVVNFIGVTVGRQYFLQRHGFDAALTTLIVSYERVLLGIVSALLAFMGAGIVLGVGEVAAFFEDQPLLFMLPSALAALIVSGMVFDTSSDLILWSRIAKKECRSEYP